MKPIIPPTNCPSCNSELVVNDSSMLYCTNPNCDAKTSKKILHFAKTTKIKGLGEATISKLGLETIQDIYQLDEQLSKEVLGDKLTEKLFKEIEKSKEIPLEMLLPAFSIPLIGQTAASKLALVANDIDDLNEQTMKKAGLGPKAIQNLKHWLDNEYEIRTLPFSYKFSKVKTPEAVKAVVCITGKLTSFKTKSEAETALKQAGYEVKGSLTKDVTILINESGIESAKTEKARQAGVLIVTNINNILGEN